MIPPPAGQDSWAWSTRSPSPYTTVSSKPNASTRNRISPRASRARSVGQTYGGGVLSFMTASLAPRRQARLGRFGTLLAPGPLRTTPLQGLLAEQAPQARPRATPTG